MAGAVAEAMAGGAGAEAMAAAVATTGGARRGRGGSGAGGPDRACARAGRFSPWSPSSVLRRRRLGCGAKLVDLDEAAVDDGDAGVGHGGSAAGGGAAAAEYAAAGVRPVADQDTAGAGAVRVDEKNKKLPLE